VSRLKEV